MTAKCNEMVGVAVHGSMTTTATSKYNEIIGQAIIGFNETESNRAESKASFSSRYIAKSVEPATICIFTYTV